MIDTESEWHLPVEGGNGKRLVTFYCLGFVVFIECSLLLLKCSHMCEMFDTNKNEPFKNNESFCPSGLERCCYPDILLPLSGLGWLSCSIVVQ